MSGYDYLAVVIYAIGFLAAFVAAVRWYCEPFGECGFGLVAAAAFGVFAAILWPLTLVFWLAGRLASIGVGR